MAFGLKENYSEVGQLGCWHLVENPVGVKLRNFIFLCEWNENSTNLGFHGNCDFNLSLN